MRLDDTARYAEANTGSGANRFGGEERIEYARTDRRFDPGAAVAHCQFHPPTNGACLDADPARLRSFLNRLTSIHQQVHQHLLHLIRIA